MTMAIAQTEGLRGAGAGKGGGEEQWRAQRVGQGNSVRAAQGQQEETAGKDVESRHSDSAPERVTVQVRLRNGRSRRSRAQSREGRGSGRPLPEARHCNVERPQDGQNGNGLASGPKAAGGIRIVAVHLCRSLPCKPEPPRPAQAPKSARIALGDTVFTQGLRHRAPEEQLHCSDSTQKASKIRRLRTHANPLRRSTSRSGRPTWLQSRLWRLLAEGLLALGATVLGGGSIFPAAEQAAQSPRVVQRCSHVSAV